MSDNTNPFAPSNDEEIEVEVVEPDYEVPAQPPATDYSSYQPEEAQVFPPYGSAPNDALPTSDPTWTAYEYQPSDQGANTLPTDDQTAPPYGYQPSDPGAYTQPQEMPYPAGAYPPPNAGYQQGPYQGPGQPYVQTASGAYQPVAMWSPKSKLAAGLLGIFLGTFGVHNFYLGYTGKAVAQLLITLLSIGMLAWVSSIWGLIEGILVLASGTGTSWDLDANGYPMQPIGS
ncbi:TM2 domain-containing protein [Actinomycetaceae bacterium MB13-C1-2]|nr:TM2 domain-containing protein [Actinomycetaceae bacterium MB13-C1-2]